MLIVMGLFCLVTLAGCKRFDAKEYTQAVLELLFQGETEGIQEFVPDASERELKDSYKTHVASFAEGLTEGLQLSEGMQDQFNKLCANIFHSLRYHVIGAEKENASTYRVTVEIEPTDVFQKWTAYLEENSLVMKEKLERGEYKGTAEEKMNQMLLDIAAQSCELLDTAVLDAQYEEKREILLYVQKEESGQYMLGEEEISRFMEKILLLDAIQE